MCTLALRYETLLFHNINLNTKKLKTIINYTIYNLTRYFINSHLLFIYILYIIGSCQDKMNSLWHDN